MHDDIGARHGSHVTVVAAAAPFEVVAPARDAEVFDGSQHPVDLMEVFPVADEVPAFRRAMTG
jgi:hypothetical protein